MKNLEGAPARIAAMIERISRITRAREATTLAPAQWEALRFLARANSLSRQPSAVAAWLATTKGTASQTLIALERKGMITRAPHPGDRRRTILDVTEAGFAQLEGDPLRDLIDTISALPPLHMAALSQSLAHIGNTLAGSQGHPALTGCDGCQYLEAPQAPATHSRCGHFQAELSDEDQALACIAYRAAA